MYVCVCVYRENGDNSDFDDQIFIGVLFILPRRHGKIFNSIKYRYMTNGYSIDLTFSWNM